jgi:predicted NBD/HSP70 family sugar kinase
MRQRVSTDETAREAAHLRALNLERVLAVAMDRKGPFTRAQLIDATGLSAPTVGSLTSQLIRTGLVEDLGTGPSRGGRRPSLMAFNPRYGFAAGIDIGPTRTRLAVTDLRGEMLAHSIVPTSSGGAPAATLARLASDLQALMKEAGVEPGQLLAVAAGAPGPVDIDRGVITFAPNLKGWTDVPIRDILHGALGAPVLVENDVNVALLGEHGRGAARGHDTCAFIFVGTGIGAAFLIDGAIHRGHHYMAGEIAVMCMGPQYVEQNFGSRGCLEVLAGLEALAARWPRAAGRDPADWMAELFSAAARGDVEARQAIDETARLIAIAAVNVGTVVDPSIVVLGGALFVQAEPLVVAVREVVQKLSRAPVQLVVSALGKEAPLAGCVLVAATEARRQVRLKLRSGLRRIS